MKKLLLSISCIVVISGASFSQSNFGMDIIIDNAPIIDQRKPVVSTAFNGWLYSAYQTIDTTTNGGGITIRRSIDKGITWQLIDSYNVPDIRYEDVEIEVAGTDTNNLTLFVLGIKHNTTSGSYIVYLDRYNATTLGFIGSTFNYQSNLQKIYDIDLATDYEYPGVNASPFSVSILFSRYSSTLDSLFSYTSIDGGASFPATPQIIYSTSNYLGKVALSYGRSSSASNGRYFAAWERRTSGIARNGNIYTAHNASTIDGPWNIPVNLDSLSSTMIGLCRNPRIATQYNNTDNDSASLTAVVLVERDYTGNGSDYDLLGFYNKRAHFTNFWYRLDVNNSGENDIHPDIIYDTDSSFFRATYYDSTNAKLPYLKNDMNLLTPSTWTISNVQYNDVTPGASPFPRISHNKFENGISAVWSRQNGTKGIAMFDADYTVVFAGLDENNKFIFDISAYPNPTTDILNIDLKGIDFVDLQVLNNNGQTIMQFNNVSDNQIINMSDISSGIYFLRMEYKGEIITKKIIKN